MHLIATVIWLGGMGLLLLVIYPLAARDPDRWAALLPPLERRFRPMANLSLLVLLVTGVVQTAEDPNYGGLLDFSTPWSQAILAKHIAFGGMVAIVLFLQFGLRPAMDRADLLARKQSDQATTVQALRRREQRLTSVNFALGMVVLFFTAIATAI
ncbi:MAG: CopD family protein [Anaerolineales bacterium]